MVYKKILMGMIILLALLIPSVQAYRSYCLDDYFLINEVNMTKNESGTITTYIFEDTTYCPHGCEDNITKYGADCIEPAYIVTIQVIVGIIILFIIIIFVASRGKR